MWVLGEFFRHGKHGLWWGVLGLRLQRALLAFHLHPRRRYALPWAVHFCAFSACYLLCSLNSYLNEAICLKNVKFPLKGRGIFSE